MTKISDLSAVTSVASGDEFVLARSATTKKIDADFLPGFEFNYVEKTSDTSITASTEATATTVVTAGAITYDGSTVIMVEFFAPLFSAGLATTDCFVALYDGAGSIGQLCWARTPVASNASGFALYAVRRLTPSAAAHTYSIRVWSSVAGGGSLTIHAGAGGSGVRVPTFIRQTKA